MGRGDRGLAAELYDRAADLCEDASMALHRILARRCRGQLTGVSALVDEADAWLRAEGVADPDRLTACLI